MQSYVGIYYLQPIYYIIQFRPFYGLQILCTTTSYYSYPTQLLTWSKGRVSSQNCMYQNDTHHLQCTSTSSDS